MSLLTETCPDKAGSVLFRGLQRPPVSSVVFGHILTFDFCADPPWTHSAVLERSPPQSYRPVKARTSVVTPRGAPVLGILSLPQTRSPVEMGVSLHSTGRPGTNNPTATSRVSGPQARITTAGPSYLLPLKRKKLIVFGCSEGLCFVLPAGSGTDTA